MTLDGLFRNYEILYQIKIINIIINCIVLTHTSFVIFGLLHALWGQYFFMPMVTENIELHIGRRRPYSVYSGGHTAWQEPHERENKFNRRFPKIWYGWLGRGTDDKSQILNRLKRWLRKLIRKWLKKLVRKIRR